MLATHLIEQLAAELDASEKSRVQLAHFSKRFPEMTVADGYAISRQWVKQKIAAGRVARGHKIGLTSRAMQQSSQIDEPDYGTLLEVVKQHVAPWFDESLVGITLQIDESPGQVYDGKHSTLHPLFNK